MVKKLTAIRLDPKQIAQLERIAKREDRAVSYIIRKAIDDYIRRANAHETHGTVCSMPERSVPAMAGPLARARATARSAAASGAVGG